MASGKTKEGYSGRGNVERLTSRSCNTCSLSLVPDSSAIGVVGILGTYLKITALTSIWQGYMPIALSIAFLWSFFGLVLIIHARRLLSGASQILVGTVLAIIAVSAALAIVKRIMEVHGGKIWGESEGSEYESKFLFILPVSLPDETDTHNKGNKGE